MADYGLQVMNLNGYVQIDSTYKNLALLTSGSVLSGGSATPDGWYAASISISGTATPIIAVLPSSCYAVLISTTVSGSVTTYNYYCNAAGVSLKYWVFDDPSLVSASGNYGLVVYNPSGAKVFDSRVKYMRVLGMLSGTSLSSVTSTSYSGTPAVVQCQLRGGWSAAAAPNNVVSAIYNAATFSVSSGTVSLVDSAISHFNQTSGATVNTTKQSAYTYLILDVSNM